MVVNVTALYKDIDDLKKQVIAKEQARAEEELKRIDAENKYSRTMLHYARLMKKTCGGRITERQSLTLAGLDVLDIIELRDVSVRLLKESNDQEFYRIVDELGAVLKKIGAL